MKSKRSGFTLVEILIVVVILGILAAIVIPQFTEASTEAKLSALCTDLQTMRSQIELYKIQHNDFPPEFANFTDQMTGTTDIDGLATGSDYGPYMQKIPINQFNNDDTITNDGLIGDDGGGWEYDENTGSINADDDYDENPKDSVSDHINL
jgi:general secretion pathway protein G